MCPICNVTNGGLHHYDCPYDNHNEKRVITWNAQKNELEKYPAAIKWRRPDGTGYIIVKPN